MLALAASIASRGHRVELVLARAEGPWMDRVPREVRVVDLKASRVIRSVPALARYLRESRPQTVVSAMAYANVAAVAARAMSGAKTRVVVTEHSMLSVAVDQAAVRRARVLPWLMRVCYPRAAGVIAVSGGVADDLAATIGMPRERIRVIYNPVVTDELLRRSQDEPDHPWFREKGIPVVLGVGRLTRAKDFATLVRAFARLRESAPARLVLLGEGEEREAVQELAASLGVAEDLSMPGFVDNPFAYMRRASVFVLSSRWEGLPTVLIEAMACGCRVVSTNCRSGPEEILDRGKYGALVAVGDVVGMSRAMSAALEDPNPTDPTARAQEFTVERATDRYLEFLMGLAPGHSGAGP